MSDVWDIVRPKVNAALAEAEKESISSDVVGRALLACAIEVYKMSRADADICAELQFKIDNIDETEAFGFMRP
ncbi:MAG: hypothetical protein AB7R90_06125 [Reyranellaceae bacterium]